MDIKITSELKSLETKWPEFNVKHPQGNIFQSPEMFNVFKDTQNYNPSAWFAIDDNNDICGLLVANKIKEFNKLMEGLSSRSIIQGGPLVFNPLHLSKLLEQYSKDYAKKVLFTQVRNIFDTSNELDVFVKNGYEYEPHLNYLIKLDDMESVWNNLNKKRRTSIRSAQKKDVTVQELKNESEIETFYTIIKATYKRVKVPLADISLFTSAYKHLNHKKMVKYFFAMHEEKYIGALALLNYKDRSYMWFLGSLDEYLKYNPNDLLVWESISWAIKNGYKIYDMGGAGHPDKEYGVRKFKSEFGGNEVNLGRYQIIHSPLKMKISELGYNVYRRLKL